MSLATTSAPARRITPDDLLQMDELGRYEALIDGVLMERNVSYLSSYTGYEFNGRIRNHVHEHRLGYGFQSDCGLLIFPWAPGLVRFADGGFISHSRGARPDRGHLSVAPDLVVEVVSRGDRAEELEMKCSDYLRAGVREVWVAYPRTRHVVVWRTDGSAISLSSDAMLEGGSALPGFSCRVGDLFLEPDAEEAPEPPRRRSRSRN